MRFLGLILGLCLCVSNVFGQERVVNVPEGLNNSHIPMKSLDSELADVNRFIARLPEHQASRLRFFTTYAVPRRLRNDAVLTLSFWIHSLVGLSTESLENGGGYYPLAMMVDGEFKPIRNVPGSDTLWWVNLDELNWTEQAWETVSDADGYVRQPVVDHRHYNYLRLIAGNALLRADWFIAHTSNTARQDDIDKEPLYYELLYAKSGIPKDVADFQRIWGGDPEQARKFASEFGSLITNSKAVAYNNRIITGYRTTLGYYYQTYDVKNQEGHRDYFENIPLGKPPKVVDAGEAITVNQLGLQVYFLLDDKGNRIEFGQDPIVRDTTTWHDTDTRVITGRSCVICHVDGINPVENTLAEMMKTRQQLNIKDPQDYLATKRFYLSGKLEQQIKDDQILYARAVARTNGLTTAENAAAFKRIIDWYDKDLTVSQAAHECGVTAEYFKAKVGVSVSGRLGAIITRLRPMPRKSWESVGADGVPGHFAQAMLILKGTTLQEIQQLQQQAVENLVEVYVVTKDTHIYSGRKKLQLLRAGTVLENVDLDHESNSDNWVHIIHNGVDGFVPTNHVEIQTQDIGYD